MRGWLAVLVAALATGNQDAYEDKQLGQHRYRELVTPVVKSANDQRAYLGLELANKMRVLLVSDPAAGEAAASLDVAVGSKADPIDMQGMAHFCEHLLFMGTTKYPDVNDFFSYVDGKGGLHNAITSYENTNYHFSVGHDGLDGALDRFAQFFIAPLFNEATVEKEVEAVESELSLDIETDFFRNSAVMKLVSNQSHPFSFNNNGNRDTLYEGPIARRVDPRQRVMDFYNTHYSANLMRLVVFGRESLETLKGLVIPKFAAVSNKNAKALAIPGSPFTADQLGIQVGIDGLADDHLIFMQFLMPSYKHSAKKPLDFLVLLLGGEGPGSVKAHLLEKRWIFSAKVWAQHSSRDFSTLDVYTELTAAGFQNKEALVQLYFDAARLAVQQGIPKYIYDEMKALKEIEFQQQDFDPIALTRYLASQMHNGPLSATLSKDLLKEFDATLINATFSNIRLENLRLSVISKSPKNTLEHPKYGIRYSVAPLNHTLFKPSNVKLELPKPNPYMPSNFVLLNTDPRVVRMNEAVWYAGNPLRVPKAAVRVLFQSGAPSPQEEAALEILKRFIKLRLGDKISAAKKAGLSLSVSASSHGLEFHFDGYSHRMEGFVCDVLGDTLADNPYADMYSFLAAKESTQHAYSFFPFFPPVWYSDHFLQMALENNTCTFDVFNATIPTVTHQAFVAFAKSVLQAPVKVLVVGNMVSSSAERILACAKKRDGSPGIPSPAAVVVPRRDSVFRSTLPNKNETDSAIKFYLELFVHPDPEMHIAARSLASLLYPFAFNRLRNEEQLGYVVDTNTHDVGTRGGIVIDIISTHDPIHLESRIEAMLAGFRSHLEAMNDFQAQVEGLVTRLESHKSLEDRADKYWDEITSGNLDFERDQIAKDELAKLTQARLLAIVDQYVLKGAPNRRKFSTHVVSHQAQPPVGGYSLADCGRLVKDLAAWSTPQARRCQPKQ